MVSFKIESGNEKNSGTVLSEFNNSMEEDFASLIKLSDTELANPYCDYDKVLSFVNRAITEVDPQLLSDIQKQALLNVISITKEQAKEQFSQSDPIKYCLLETEISKIHDQIVEVDDAEYERKRVRKATIADGNEAFKSVLNCVRRKTFTTREALNALLEMNSEEAQPPEITIEVEN